MSDRLTDEEIEEIRGRVEAATEGPWRACVPVKGRMVTQVIGRDVLGNSGVRVADYVVRPDDTGFIAHARTDIPRLLDEVERLRRDYEGPYLAATDYIESIATEYDKVNHLCEAVMYEIEERDHEITRLTDQAQRDAGKIELLTEEVDRLRTGTCVQRLVYDLNDEELASEKVRIDGLRGIYTSKVEYAVDLAVAAIDDELQRRKLEATDE